MSAAAPPRSVRLAGEGGSGTAIGVAVMFPALMLVIVVIQLASSAARADVSLQSATDRAALTASLCCRLAEPADDMARESLALLEADLYREGVQCVNNVGAEAEVVFYDRNDKRVFEQLPDPDDAAWTPVPLDARVAARTPVPLGGRVLVFAECRLAPSRLGGYAVGLQPFVRTAVGMAAVDPFRSRSEEPPSQSPSS